MNMQSQSNSKKCSTIQIEHAVTIKLRGRVGNDDQTICINLVCMQTALRAILSKAYAWEPFECSQLT